MRPPEPPTNPDKYAPSNIFAAMKKTDFGKPEDERPQESVKYDALRPLTTGECSTLLALPVLSLSHSHFHNLLTLLSPSPDLTQPLAWRHAYGVIGYNGAPMMAQQTGMNGMLPQMTGYNPQMQMGMGYMGQQGPYGQQQQQQYR